MGYEYYGIGNGLELEEEVFPPSDLEMMEEIVPRFVDEDHFMVYCLTVSGHLNYNREGNVMSDRHYERWPACRTARGPRHICLSDGAGTGHGEPAHPAGGGGQAG